MIQQSQEIREIWSSFALQVQANAICKEKVPTIFKSKRYTVFAQQPQNLMSSLLFDMLMCEEFGSSNALFCSRWTFIAFSYI